MTQKEILIEKNEHIKAIEDAVDVFRNASAHDGITLNASQSRYICLLFEHYLNIIKKLNGIWR
jgi:hypothetical protein